MSEIKNLKNVEGGTERAQQPGMSKHGFILKATDNLPHPYLYSFIRGELNHVDDKDMAWFTESRDVAAAMASDLYRLASVSYFVVEHAHDGGAK